MARQGSSGPHQGAVTVATMNIPGSHGSQDKRRAALDLVAGLFTR